MQLDRTERRILGSLIEKRWSTPDQYPLSLNALVAACNQKSNRDPALSLEDFEISGCLMGLREKGLVLIRDRDGGRVQRYAEKLTEELTLEPLAGAVIAELMLRGPQTAPELSRRVTRMVPVDGVGPLEECLADLARNHLVMLQGRQSGQRHARWVHLLRDETEGEDAEVARDVIAPAITEAADDIPLFPVSETIITPADETVAPPAPDPIVVAPEPTVVAPEPTVVAPEPEPVAVPEEPDLKTEVEELRREVADLRERLERLESVVL